MFSPTPSLSAQSAAPSQPGEVGPSRESTTTLEASICTFGEPEGYGSQDPPEGIAFGVMILAGAALVVMVLSLGWWSGRKACAKARNKADDRP